MPASASASASSPPRPKKKRIAAVEPHDVQPAARSLDEDGADLSVGERATGVLSAGAETLGVRRREIQQRGIGRMIEEHDIGCFEDAAALARDQLRIPRPRADKIDLGHRHEIRTFDAETRRRGGKQEFTAETQRRRENHP